MNSMTLGNLLHMLNSSGLVWPALKVQFLVLLVKVAIMAEMEVWFDPSKSISKFEFLKLTFFEKNLIFTSKCHKNSTYIMVFYEFYYGKTRGKA